MNIKLKVVFRDRIGIVADVSALVANFGLNISAMEVERKDDRAENRGYSNLPRTAPFF